MADILTPALGESVTEATIGKWTKKAGDAVKKDEVSELITNPSGGFVPQIARREVSTAVLIDNGQTVVVGGVYEFSNREDLRKVPFLGDLPVLGNLFKNKTRGIEKAELLIFVTPRILQVAHRGS